MNINLIVPGKVKQDFIQQGVSEYRKRLGRFAKLDIQEVKIKIKSGTTLDCQLFESEQLVAKANQDSFKIALDPGGRNISSEDLAQHITKWQDQSIKAVDFIIGGPLGFAPLTLQKFDFILSLSAMTFTHDMARLLLLEQIYRAYTIKAGTGYHK